MKDSMNKEPVRWQWYRDMAVAFFLVVWCGLFVFVFLVSNGAFGR